ncbi:uncharacterized protein LOC113228653 [Hyposmocoma kahamanoa]|uniref:uncharacterized protein LOC113228653 n=1 Tax=Hyposmocoma kahamanoa TaxID=1477025 RepID=UPI000E6D6951|nr:uncharacterized protein LOC113228653 [Hyposmocoma kahamanoa]
MEPLPGWTTFCDHTRGILMEKLNKSFYTNDVVSEKDGDDDEVSMTDGDTSTNVRTRKRQLSKASIRSRSRSRSLSLSDEGSTRSSASKIPTARRGRGRPPTTGQYVGLAKAKNEYIEARRRELQVQAEEETADLAHRLREQRLVTAKEVAQCTSEVDTAEVISKQIRDDVSMILTVAKNSGNLKGTYQKSLKDVAASIEANFEKIRTHTVSEETKALQANNNFLNARIKELEKKLAVLEATIEHMNQQRMSTTAADKSVEDPALSMDMTPDSMLQPQGHRRTTTSNRGRRPPSLSPQSDVDQRLLKAIMMQVGTMVNARFESFEERLPPAERLRPPLAADAKTRKKASFASVVEHKLATAPHTTDPKMTGNPSPDVADTQQGKKKKGANATIAKAPKATNKPPTTSVPNPGADEEGWNVVVGGRKARKKAATGTNPKAKPPPAKKKKPKLRPPRSAAVVITLQAEAIEKGITYADVLLKAKESVVPAELGIEHIRFRQAATGARILELPGTEGAKHADKLAEKLRGALGEVVKVARPTKCADLRISGLDDSVSPSDVLAEIARKGNCDAGSVKVGEIRRGPGGMGTVVAKCPVAAAKTLVDAGRILVGWSAAQVRALEPRPLKCFRCLEGGHTRARCTAQIDRSELCYRCDGGTRLVRPLPPL